MGFTPQLERLAIRLGSPARILAGRTKAGAAAPQARPESTRPESTRPESARPDPACAALSLDVPVHPFDPQSRIWAQATAAHAALATAGRWPELLAALRAADQGRTTLAGGKRLMELVSAGARGALAAAIARMDMDAARAELARFDHLARAHPGDHTAAHLLAQAHLDLGWAVRGTGLPGQIARADWQTYLRHIAAAEAALDPFDPLECDSPLLAATRYLLVRGLDEGASLCADWYEDWCDLDPSNQTPHATHAPHLLPDWYGVPRDFDAAARQAASRTEADMGAAAYAMFYLAAADAADGLPTSVDLALMLQGLSDFHAQTGCQARANIAAATLTEMAHLLHLDGPAAGPDLALVQAALRGMVTGHLREFHLNVWEAGLPCIHWALAQVFGPDLPPGARVTAGVAGLCLVAG